MIRVPVGLLVIIFYLGALFELGLAHWLGVMK